MANMLFTPVPRTLKDIIMEIENGKLGLPELQRGYVWKATKVRDLLDSMMKGYPIGYLMIWDSSDSSEKVKHIGLESKPFSSPKSLIIDGQQRMTSLYAVMRHKEIVDEKFNKRYITISFNPFTRAFEVGDNAKKRAVDWIYDISEVFLNESRSFSYINELECVSKFIFSSIMQEVCGCRLDAQNPNTCLHASRNGWQRGETLSA